MRIRNKRRKHYLKYGWKKFLDSYLKFNYEITFSEPYAVNNQLVVDVNIAGKKFWEEVEHQLSAALNCSVAVSIVEKDGNDG